MNRQVVFPGQVGTFSWPRSRCLSDVHSLTVMVCAATSSYNQLGELDHKRRLSATRPKFSWEHSTMKTWKPRPVLSSSGVYWGHTRAVVPLVPL